MPSKYLIFCYPLLLPSIFPSIRIFSNELALLIRCPKYWSFSFSISLSNEYLGLISFRIDWFNLGISRVCPCHSSKASILQFSAFFYCPALTSVHDYRKTIALTRWTFVGKAMCLLFNTLSRFVIALLPRSKRLLISLLNKQGNNIQL